MSKHINLRSLLARKVYNPPLLRVVSVITIIYLLYYIGWRATHSLNPQAPLFSWALLLAEGFGIVNYALFAWMTRDVSPKYPYKDPQPRISVDIFVPTYNEDLEVLEATLIGCKKMQYPHKTYVLDDGKRLEVERLASRLGCEYLTRPDNYHAKAGNINHALTKTQGEYIVVLDADMVPQPDFLTRTLGYFENEKLAFVQMPQEFYNQDSIQHDMKVDSWHEQSLFYRVIQPGKNYTNSAFWCGSPSIIRRAALEDIGGVAVETITEDIHTSVRLHSRGWESLFLNEVLAYGIAPQTIRAFLLQRLRWAQGTMQLYRSKESPLWIPGLTPKQRISYLSSFLAYFEAFQKLIFLLTPTLIILFRIYPMQVGLIEFMLRWIPYFILSIAANKIGGRGYFRYFLTEKYNLLKMITFIQSTATLLFKKPLKFRVTPKSVNDSVYRDERRAISLHAAILGMIVGTVLFGFALAFLWGYVNPFSFFIANMWAAYNATLITAGVLQVLRKRHERRQYRFVVQLPGILFDEQYSLIGSIQLNDISLMGAKFVLEKGSIDTDKVMNIYFRPHDDKKGILLPIRKIHYQRNLSGGRRQMGVSLAEVSISVRERLLEFLFVDLPRGQAKEAARSPILKWIPAISRLLESAPPGFQTAAVIERSSS